MYRDREKEQKRTPCSTSASCCATSKEFPLYLSLYLYTFTNIAVPLHLAAPNSPWHSHQQNPFCPPSHHAWFDIHTYTYRYIYIYRYIYTYIDRERERERDQIIRGNRTSRTLSIHCRDMRKIICSTQRILQTLYRGHVPVEFVVCLHYLVRASCYTSMRHVTCRWVMSHINESCHISMSRVTCKRAMSHIIESFHIWMSLVTYQWVMSHINESCHMWTSRVTFNESCHISISRWCIEELRLLTSWCVCITL